MTRRKSAHTAPSSSARIQIPGTNDTPGAAGANFCLQRGGPQSVKSCLNHDNFIPNRKVSSSPTHLQTSQFFLGRRNFKFDIEEHRSETFLTPSRENAKMREILGGF
eukprot:1819355-Rhodomonas_salina.1